jgi:putative MFS transporter
MMGHDSVKGIDEVRAPLCGSRLDRLPTTHWINRVFLLTSLAILFAWSNYVSGLVLAQLCDIGWIDATSSAMFSSIYMAGMLFGSLLGGVIGDSIGRRKSYLLFVGIHTISMYLAAVTSSVIMLIATRALMGFGLGALLVSLFASLAEYVPTSQRGIWMGRNSFIGNCGGPIASLLAAVISPFVTVETSWRLMFLIPAIMSTIIWLFALRYYPESPRWLESRGEYDKANAVMGAIERKVRREYGKELPQIRQQGNAALTDERGRGNAGYRELLRGELSKRVILGASVLVAMNVTAYTLMTWLPTMLLIKGIDVGHSFALYTFTVLGAPVGTFLGMVFIDKASRKCMGISLLGIIAIFGPLFAIQQNEWLLCVMGFSLEVVTEMYVAYSSGVYVPEIWPTELRLRGSGLSNAIGRISGVVAPVVVAQLLARGTVMPVFILMSSICLVVAIVIFVLGVDTRRRTVEEIG